MQTETIFENRTFQSDGATSSRDYTSKPTNAPANAKHMIAFLDINSLDSNVRIQVDYEDSADGVNWHNKTTTVLDTGDTTAADIDVYRGSVGESFGAWARFNVRISPLSGAGGPVEANASLKVVFKPF